jgi:hypothetical protein
MEILAEDDRSNTISQASLKNFSRNRKGLLKYYSYNRAV